MANEIQAYIPTGKTLYAVLLNAVGTVWNGSTFEAVSAVNWANYDIALVEVTAGLYRANMPAVVAGSYSAAIYQRIGATPATTDTLVGIGHIEWDGTAIMPLSTLDTNIDSILADTGTDGVLISSGTGAKQISLSSGAVLLQATQTGVTIPIVTTTGTATNLTNAPTAGDFTATMKSSITTAATSATPVLSAAGIDAILDEVVVGTYTMRKLLAVMASALAGKVTGGGTSTITFRGVDDTTNVIVATVDTSGNRSAITLTV